MCSEGMSTFRPGLEFEPTASDLKSCALTVLPWSKQKVKYSMVQLSGLIFILGKHRYKEEV